MRVQRIYGIRWHTYGKVFGINLDDGKIAWVFTTESYKGHHLMYFKLGAITVDRKVISSSDGTVYGLKK